MYVGLALVLVSALLPHLYCDPYNKALHFPEELSTENYVLIKPDFSEVQEAISICSWVKILHYNTYASVWFSYATTRTDNEIILFNYLSDVILFNQDRGGVGYVESVALGEWQHCCMTWRFAEGLFKLYVNGVMEVSKRLQSGSRKIGTSGTLVLGQEQDTVGGGFDVKQTFVGDIYQLNVFSRPLTANEIEIMFRNGHCSYLDDSLLADIVLSWEDVLEGYRHSSVSVVAPECEKLDWKWGWDILHNFLGQSITEDLINHLEIEHSQNHDKVLHFPVKTSLENYVLMNPDFSKVESSITICSWVKMFIYRRFDTAWFSYATSTTALEIVLLDYLSYVVFFNGIGRNIYSGDGVTDLLNKWQHCCLTWDFSTQVFNTYINGAYVKGWRTDRPTRTIGITGTLVLGQFQTREGEGFGPSNSFSGEIYQLNVFGRHFTADEIESLFQKGHCYHMDDSLLDDVVLSWKDVLKGYRHGDVSAAPPRCVKWEWKWDWNTLRDFVGQNISEELIEHLKIEHHLY